ncbi:hypothetical protein BX070DRAFT_219865, partial [Coemansia spiralis]
MDTRWTPAAQSEATGGLPADVLTRIFSYLFWPGTQLPAHQALIPALHTSHRWRRRAARLFYSTVTIGHPASNVRLVLESGYAPRASHLVVHSELAPEQIATLLMAAFSRFEWAGIHTLCFVHLWARPMWLDEGITRVNQLLAKSLPNLTRITAISGTQDSFGLFILDDLLAARAPQLTELVVRSPRELSLGVHELTKRVTKLVIWAAGGGRHGYKDDGEDKSPIPPLHSMPRICAQPLVELELGPVAPDNIWFPFFPARDTYMVEFTCLRSLKLIFSSSLLLASDPEKHLNGKTSSSVYNAPVFPVLESLMLTAYPHDIVLFLENFPRAQLRRLHLVRCPNSLSSLSFAPFPRLTDVHIDAAHTDKVVAHLLQAPGIATVKLTGDFARPTEMPSDFGPATIQKLTLKMGLRLIECEKLLVGLPRLRSLDVVVTECVTKAHEALSRSARRGRRLKEQRGTGWRLSSSLEVVLFRFAWLGGRHLRAVRKAAWIIARVPSLLCVAVESEFAPMLRGALSGVRENASADIAHLEHLRVVDIN